MSTYHNAVSDKLILFIDDSLLVYSIYGKDNQLKFRVFSSEHEFPDELSSSIFSVTHVQIVNAKFSLAPLNEENLTSLYELNHGKSSQLTFNQNEIFKIGFEKPSALDKLDDKLVNANLITDIELFYEHGFKLKHPNAIYFYEYGGLLSIIAWKKGSFLLCNRYDVANVDELFYYIMLVVEQLDIPIESIYVACVSSDEKFVQYQTVFKNYLPVIERLIGVDSDQKQAEENDHVLTNFFAQCVL